MSTRRAFVIMPFGKKTAADGAVIDFDAVYKGLLAPAIAAADLAPHRADADRRGGSIHLDMFQDLLLADFVVADLTLDNPNVWYEIGVRHALRAGGTVLTYALRDRLPFDIAGQRMQRFTLKEGKLDPDLVKAERTALTEAIEATLGAWRGRRASPVYQQLPNLKEPDWKTLKVGDVNEFWQGLEAWKSRVEVARHNQRPGDILVLAEETPNSVLEFEALRTAADVLLKLNRSRYALSVIERARQLDPDDVKARQVEAIALGRAGRYVEARETLRRLSEERKDGETLGLLAGTWKDEWTQLWNTDEQRKLEPLTAAREANTTLARAASAYAEAFRAAPGDYYPGINALTFGRLWEHVTGRESQLPLAPIAAGIAWSTAAAIERNKDYRALVTRAELALIENRKNDAIYGYSEAAAIAVDNRDWFALDSSSQQLDFLGELKFQSEIVAEASAVIDRAKQQLRALLGNRPEQRAEPAHVVVFSGHMIDDPKVRGEGKEKPPRFPPAKIEAAAARIRGALDEVGAGDGDLGLCGGASGGDLLFAEACLERGMRVALRLARPENEFLAESVTFADPDRRWERSFMRVKENAATTVLVMPEKLGLTPDGVSVHDRCNRWILYTALSHGLPKAAFITLWNGVPGDGPGGTQNMVEVMRKLAGRQPIFIDPATLGEEQAESDATPLRRQPITIDPATLSGEHAESDTDGATPLKVFISYSHKDERMRVRLGQHLAPMIDQGLIEIWHDREIDAGANWEDEIDREIEEADIILLLVSPDFISSDYCRRELLRAIEQRSDGKSLPIPIILRDCEWPRVFNQGGYKAQAVPRDDRPIAGGRWPNQDTAFANVARELRRVIERRFQRINSV